MNLTIEEIIQKMDDLGLWKLLEPWNFAVKPHGSAIPYFCLLEPATGIPRLFPSRVRLLLLEGWRTLQDYACLRRNDGSGTYTAPMELPHYEVCLGLNGERVIFRNRPALLIKRVKEPPELARLATILWECYGVLLRLESEHDLPLKFASEGAVFARVETAPGVWEDQPLAIPPLQVIPAQIRLDKDLLQQAKDLPFDRDLALDFDFRLNMLVSTGRNPRLTLYHGMGINAKTGERFIEWLGPVKPDLLIKDLWECCANILLDHLVRKGRLPGELRVKSQRVFRFLRPLCVEFPIKLSLHDNLDRLESEFQKIPTPKVG